MSETVEVFWGSKWESPSEWFLKDEKTVIAFVETYTGKWKHVKFTNRIRGPRQWRKTTAPATPSRKLHELLSPGRNL